MHFKAVILGLVVAGACLCAGTGASADTIGLNSDRPTVYKMRQEGDVLIVEFYVPTNYNAYHLIVNGPGQNGKQLEFGGNGWLSHTIKQVRANQTYTVSVQGVRKSTSIFSKDDCSPWDALKRSTHEIAATGDPPS